ncbi:MAG: 2-amino-4-hydroxy-6-hydroxymethyldihydropteridine diphosphokinase [Desulfuromonadales bacterium]|nr:2-amino-4-hydroxy-6-hydroxymethyldihydropteridine diphosphokinase [Desulfuromonadales bacterium]
MVDTDPHSQRVFLGLGSNLGNRLAFLRGGRDMLVDRFDVNLVVASGVYESTALGGPADNPPFYNAVLEVATTLSPRQLLLACQTVEDEFGRTRPERWAPRTLDIDILLYGDLVVDDPELIIPHPRFYERAFVLAPLLAIAPELVCPRQQRPIARLVDALPTDQQPTLVRETW